MSLISCKEVRAKKHHMCGACFWFNRAGYPDSEFSPDEILIIEAAMADKWKIKPNDLYMRQVYADGGQISTFKARLDMHQICINHELYPEE